MSRGKSGGCLILERKRTISAAYFCTSFCMLQDHKTLSGKFYKDINHGLISPMMFKMQYKNKTNVQGNEVRGVPGKAP
jgi:hypothetical protein